MKTKLQLDLAGILKRKHPHGFHVPVDIDLDAILEFADDDWEHELDIDVHELLAERRAIALIWDAEQLLSHYPHLTEDQAWEVLQECARDYKGEEGLTWDDIAVVVCERFPEPERGILPPDPDGQNDARAAWAETGIQAFCQATGTHDEDALPDLLCDLMHWADRRDYDFGVALDRARGHYTDETKGV